MDIVPLINKMFIFLVLIMIGYISARMKIAGPEFTRAASKLVVNVFMSATILEPVLSSELSISGGELAQVMLVMCVAVGLCWAVALLVPVPKSLGEDKPTFRIEAAATNLIFMGLPVVDALYGSQAVFYCALACMPFNISIYVLGVWVLQGGGMKLGLKELLSVPLVMALLALAIFFIDPPVPQVLLDLCSALSGATMPMSMVVVGAGLGSVGLADAFKRKELYYMSFVRLILAPLIIWLVLGFITSDPVLRGTATFIFACPTAVLVSVLAIQYGKDPVFASEGVMVTTVLSMFTIPLMVALLA